MPATPRSGVGYTAAKNSAEAGKKRPTTAALTPETDGLDLQSAQGNDYVNEMLKGGQQDQASSGIEQLPLPAEIRWKLLSSNDLGLLANLIYSHCTPSATISKEMLAIGSVYWNRWEHTMAHPDDQKQFGPPDFLGMTFEVQRQNPLYYDPKRQSAFHRAARFGSSTFESELDVQTAVNCVKVADQMMSGVNPFPHRYMYMDLAGNNPDTERVDPDSHCQWGKLHFWAMKADAIVPEKSGQAATPGPLQSTASSAEPGA